MKIKDFVKNYMNASRRSPNIRYRNQSYYIRQKNNSWLDCSQDEAAQFIYRQLDSRARELAVVNKILECIKIDPDFKFGEPELQSRKCIITVEGRLDLEDLSVKPVNDIDFETHMANFQFNPKASWQDAPNFSNFLKTSMGIDVSEKEEDNPRRRLLMEILTYAVSRLYGAKKMIILLGPSNSGKTVVLNLIRFIVGPQGYSPLSLSDLSDRFRSAALMNSSLIINDELGERGLKNLDIIKKIISGEPLTVENKGKNPMKCIPHVKVLFASNSLPMLKEYDAENAFVNRIQVLRFTKSIPREKWDIELSQKIINERNVIFSRAVLESQKFIKTLIFTDDPDSEGVLDNFRKENSTVQAFISERLESTGKNTDYICTADLYDDYSDYCESECLGALKKKDFHKILTQMGFEFGKKRPSRNQSPRASVLGVRRKPYDTVEG